jgi:acetoin utilization deacetylase AcuC-like enzyme
MTTPDDATRHDGDRPVVGLLRDQRFQQHETTPNHPEHPGRLSAIDDLLDSAGLPSQLVAITPTPADEEALRRVHDASLLATLASAERRAQTDRVFLDNDTVMSAQSGSVARLAAGGVLRAAELVAAGDLDSAFCLPRPPGHHATAAQAMGFCLINNVAVAAAHLRARGLAQRVAVIDFDVHHGNGTQDIFYREPDVLYISTHQFPLYPGTGRAEETGGGNAAGTTLNLPLPPGCGDAEYLACIDAVVLPALRRYSPDVILVSAGFDAHWRDPLSLENLTGDGYRAMTERIQTLASDIGARTLYVLEGGYDVDALAWSVRHCIDVLLGHPPTPDPIGAPPNPQAPDIARVIEQARDLHSV